MIESISAVLTSLVALMLVYMVVAVAVFGCPHCGYPDMKWPVTVLELLHSRFFNPTTNHE